MLAGIFLYLALRGLDWNAFVSSIARINYVYLPLLFVWGTASSLVRAMRWRVLLSADKNISPLNVFWANMAGYLGNNILPARAGELVRAIYVGKSNDIPVSFALATGLVERFMDLLALILLGSLSLASTGIVSNQLESALRVMSMFAIVGIVFLLVAPYIGQHPIALVSRLPIVSPLMHTKFEELLKHILRGVSALHHGTRAISFIFFTCIIWSMDGIGTILLASSLHLKLTLGQSFLLLSSLGLSSAIPSTPGYVGVYQYVAGLVLTPFGISRESALAFILVFQIFNLLVIAIWGSISLGVARKTVLGNDVSSINLET